MTRAPLAGSSPCPTSSRPKPSGIALRLTAAALGMAVTAGVLVAARANQWERLPGPDSSNFVDLDQINKSNVSQLQVAWFYPHGAPVFSPVFADGVLYGLGRNASSLVAIEAATGKKLWVHEGL